MDVYIKFTEDLYEFYIHVNKFREQCNRNSEIFVQIEDLNKCMKRMLKSAKRVVVVKRDQLRFLFQIIYKLMLTSDETMKTLVMSKDKTDSDVVFFVDTKFVCAELYNSLEKKFVN
jgi:hypothetical protein